MKIFETINYVDQIKPNAFSPLHKTMWLNEVEAMVQTDVMLLAPSSIVTYVYESSWSGKVYFPDMATMVCDSDPGFHVGGTVTISDLANENINVTAKILAVSSDGSTLTFAEGTFTAADEEAATLQFDGSQTEMLVGAAHHKIYYTYLMAMIDFANGEYQQFQNTITLFNRFFTNFTMWYRETYHPADGEAIELGYYLSAYAIAVKHGYMGTEEEWLASLQGDRAESTEEAQDAADVAAAYAATATDKATESAESATNALTSATAANAAQTAAQMAQSSAETAEGNAATAATNAANSADTAATLETSATNAANTATIQATAAENSASSAALSATNASTSATAANTAQTAAEMAQSSAETAQGNAEIAATSAASSANAASTSATNAATSVTAANTAQTAAQMAQSFAETAATNAANSADTAATLETSATNAADMATLQATAAENSASSAASSATNASTSATAANAAKAAAQMAQSSAETAEGNAAIAATSADSSANAASTAATNAAASATAASDSASSSSTSAANAAISATGANTAKDAAQMAQSSAETAQGNAATAATNAASSASAAATSAANASSSASAAAISATEAEVNYNIDGDCVGFKKGDEAVYTYTDHLTGPQGETGPQGPQGATGETGATGATGETGDSIASIVRTSGDGSPGTTDIYTITMTSGATASFTVYNGSDAGITVDAAMSATSANPVQNKIVQTALNNKADLVDGTVPASQLPSYVDDVVEAANYASLPSAGESGKIYITLDTNKTYRWSGSSYTEISESLALGETSSTAYRGDWGATAYTHSQTMGNPHSVTKSDVGLGNVDNTLDVNKPVSTAQQMALDAKLNSSEYTASDILSKFKSVDGSGSGTDSDLLDGYEGAWYRDPTHLVEPTYVQGSLSPTAKPLYDVSRGDRTAFLPADQIIIEQSVDAGVTWTDAGIADSTKQKLFSGERPTNVHLPLKDGIRSCDCMLRITITGMKYNVPVETPETSKYDYWNSSYVLSTERYFSANHCWQWVSSVSDHMACMVQAATGANPTNWVTQGWGFMHGWSGGNSFLLNGYTFGGSIAQTSNYWNYRFVFRTCSTAHTYNDEDLADNEYNDYAQSIYHIKVTGNNIWTIPNRYAFNEHLYHWDYAQNATFPASLTSTQFKLSALNTAPVSSGDAGVVGDIKICADYIYICIATNSWKRIPVNGWTDVQQLQSIVDTGEYFTTDTVEAALQELGEHAAATDFNLDLKADLVDGTVPASQLPSYVDDVLEVAAYASLPGTGESGKIYITLDTNKTYRWSGSGYTEISESLALGETAATAYRGDRGATAYNHSQTTGNPHGTTAAQISDLINTIYPVGSIYMSASPTSPAMLFGGTWMQIEGRFLIGTGANDANTTSYWGSLDASAFNCPAGELGGQSTHVLMTGEMPSHTHTQNSHTHTQNSHTHTQNSHTHTQNSHNHSQNPHRHEVGIGYSTSGTSSVFDWVGSKTAYYDLRTAYSTATNNATTATNQYTTATNQSTTATNQSTTATNQNTGSDGAHNNMPPYLAVYMWKRTA